MGLRPHPNLTQARSLLFLPIHYTYRERRSTNFACVGSLERAMRRPEQEPAGYLSLDPSRTLPELEILSCSVTNYFLERIHLS
jgi:hypothetical protein